MTDLDLGVAMREGMRRLASGVCVLSTKDRSNQRYAMTASSVTSVSDAPASLLVCVNKDTSMFRALEEGGPFCINVLSACQKGISILCASGTQGERRFVNHEWTSGGPDDLPYLKVAQAAFFCGQDQAFLYGTHKIIIGRICHVIVDESPISPLIYVDGEYHQL